MRRAPRWHEASAPTRWALASLVHPLRSICVTASLGLGLGAGLGVGLGHPGRARAEPPLEARIRLALEPREIDGETSRAWPAAPQLSYARAQVGAEEAWQSGGGARGEGATVCVVDTGLDLSHRDFRDEEGRTRVRWLLDLSAEPGGVHPELERAGGRVYARAELDEALERGEDVAPDRSGHGTAVASAAAGDDDPGLSEPAGTFAGIAPLAELVVVRALDEERGGFLDADVVRAARFCVDPRVSAPERTVVLLALGGHDGPHDGSSAYERAISAITRTGAAVVVAAGNDGGRRIHAEGRLVRDVPTRFTLRVLAPRDVEAMVVVVVRGAREVRASLSGERLGPWVARGQRADDGAVLVDAEAERTTRVIARGALTGEVLIEARGPLEEGARVDAWLTAHDVGASPFAPAFTGPLARDDGEVRVPATAPGVVAVGASVSRDYLEGERGEAPLTLGADERGRARFSSRGPGLHGEPLPTLLAPGGWMLVARSHAIVLGLPGAPRTESELARLARREDRIAAAGTSLSAALVAGAIAVARGLHASERREEPALLAASAGSAHLDGSASPYLRERGAGELDLPAYLALRASPEGAVEGPLELGCSLLALGPRAEDLRVVARSRAGGSALIRTALLGQPLEATGRLQGGFGSARVRVPAIRVGAHAVVTAEIEGQLMEACELPVVDPNAEGPLRVAAACRATASRPGSGLSHGPSGPLSLLAVASAIGARRRRSRGRAAGRAIEF